MECQTLNFPSVVVKVMEGTIFHAPRDTSTPILQSVLKGKSIGAITVIEEDGNWLVVDGNKRVSTLMAIYNDPALYYDFETSRTLTLTMTTPAEHFMRLGDMLSTVSFLKARDKLRQKYHQKADRVATALAQYPVFFIVRRGEETQ